MKQRQQVFSDEFKLRVASEYMETKMRQIILKRHNEKRAAEEQLPLSMKILEVYNVVAD